MKIYRISSEGVGSRWAGSKSSAVGHRIALWNEAGRPGKKLDILIEEVEVASGKAGLIDFLNTHATAGPKGG